ncbi:MAG: methyltransferase domain-containing protein [Candidatus Micrarchaeaceae archaeon]
MYIYPHIYRKLARGPQVILPKDIGIIIAYTSISKESVCVDAGAGSGWLAIALARVCKHVYSYDKREDFLRIAERNAAALGVSNLTLKHGDVFKKIDEKNVDLVTLDLPDAEKALPNAKKALKHGGYVAGYLPHTEQVSSFVKKCVRLKFSDIYTVETIVRDILSRKEGTRPSTKGIWHTAYLTFAMKP